MSLSLWVQLTDIEQEDRVSHSVPVTLHPVTALRSRSRVALSSAQVASVYTIHLNLYTVLFRRRLST